MMNGKPPTTAVIYQGSWLDTQERFFRAYLQPPFILAHVVFALRRWLLALRTHTNTQADGLSLHVFWAEQMSRRNTMAPVGLWRAIWPNQEQQLQYESQLESTRT